MVRRWRGTAVRCGGVKRGGEGCGEPCGGVWGVLSDRGSERRGPRYGTGSSEVPGCGAVGLGMGHERRDQGAVREWGGMAVQCGGVRNGGKVTVRVR
jgi:hypothetical protein